MICVKVFFFLMVGFPLTKSSH